MTTKDTKTYWVRLYISGPQSVIEQACREWCLTHEYCVTVEPTRFIYTGGEETGCVIGFINYPRFHSTPKLLWDLAMSLAAKVLDASMQHSVLIVSPQKTRWITKRSK